MVSIRCCPQLFWDVFCSFGRCFNYPVTGILLQSFILFSPISVIPTRNFFFILFLPAASSTLIQTQCWPATNCFLNRKNGAWFCSEAVITLSELHQCGHGYERRIKKVQYHSRNNFASFPSCCRPKEFTAWGKRALFTLFSKQKVGVTSVKQQQQKMMHFFIHFSLQILKLW